MRNPVKVLLVACVFSIFGFGAYAQTKRVVVIPMLGADAGEKWRGTWADDTDYNRGDLVEDLGSSYIARLTHLSAEGVNDPQNDADDGGEQDFWDLVAEKGADGIPGPEGAKGDKGDRGSPGLLDQAALDFMLNSIELGTVKRIVFVTSSTYNGYLIGPASALGGATYTDGLLAGDALCQSHADDAGLPGVYKAWLSSPGGAPSTRFAKSLGAYVGTDGVIIADDWNGLISLPLKAAISRTESNEFRTTTPMTGTTASGVRAGHDCNGWTSPSNYYWSYRGNTAATDSAWTYEFVVQCDQKEPIYCFQQ